MTQAPNWARTPTNKAAQAFRANGAASSSAYAEAALDAECQSVATAAKGTRNDTLNRAAFSIGQFIAAAELDEATARRRLEGAALAAGLDFKEIGPTINSGFLAGAAEPRGSPKNGNAAEPAVWKAAHEVATNDVAGKQPPEAKPDSAARRTQAKILLEIATNAGIEPFHTPDGAAYVDVIVNDHRETHAVASTAFKRLLRRFYFEETGSAPNDDAVRQAAGVFEAQALFSGEVRDVYLRVAPVGPRIFIDLCDSAWRAIEIDEDGWRIVDRPSVRFRRTRGMLPLPVPERGGRPDELKDILPIGDDEYVLAVAWLLMAMRGEAGCPVLVLTGEQGTGKSVAGRMLRGLIDPNAAPLRGPPRDVDQLIVMAVNSYVLVLDNLSGVSADVSDGLCRISTGGGASKRALYTDGEEYTFEGHRPVIANGIGDLAIRGDLADRTVAIRLNVIPEEKRIPERELLAKYEAARPRIIGALLDVVAHGLLNLPHTRLNGYPRMANFAQWVSACEGAIWSAGMFMGAYEVNRGDAIEVVLEADPVAAALQRHMSGRDEQVTTAADLLAELSALAGESARRSRQWPGNPRALSWQLRRLAPALRRIGLSLDLDRRAHGGRRLICIRADRGPK